MELQRCFLLLICFAAFNVSEALFRLKQGYEYIYKEEAACNLGSAGTIHVKAKVGFMPISREKTNIEILLTVHNAVLKHSNGRQVPAEDLDFSKWFSFVIIPKHGDIEKVFHSSDEEPVILAMKKAFATMVFGKLHLHDDPSLQDVNHDTISGKWDYSTEENGHEGLHNAKYKAEPIEGGIRFTKTRNKHHRVGAATNNYSKVLEYDSHLGLVRKVSIDETFETGKAPKDFNLYENDRPELPTDSAINTEIPTMTSTGTGSAEIVTANRLKRVRTKPMTGLVEGMIHVAPNTTRKQENRTRTPDFDAYFKGNLSCLAKKEKSHGSIESVDCFTGLVGALKSLPDDDLISVTEQIFNASKTLMQQIARPSPERLHVVDALFDMRTDLSIRLLVKYGFASSPETVKRMFAHFSDKRKPSFKVFDDELERYCFYLESFPIEVQDEETHQRALLLLGSLIDRHNINGQTKSAHRLASKLEDMLGFHDPYNYNKARSMLSEEDAGRYDMHHVILIESLGNAGLERSYDHIISYVNVSTHQILKRSGLHALRSFNHDKAASVLYHAATQDESHVVRHESALILRRHPRSAMFPSIQPQGSRTSTLRPNEGPESLESSRLQRARRDINDLFKPFKFVLEVPGVDWRERQGGHALAVSYGVVLRNRLDLELGIFAGHVIIDIYDEAYARLHVGIIGLNIDVVVARVCFYGEVSYNLNILQEVNFDDLVKQIKDFFNLFGNIVNAIKDGVELFSRLLNGEITIEGIIKEFMEALSNLPKKVADLGRRAMKATDLIGSIDDNELPPFIRPAKNLIHRVSNLFNDVKTDVLDFYYNITDITVIFKRSAKSIYHSVKAIYTVFNDFLDSPKQALSEVFKAIINIKVAITDAMEAIKKIKAACSFLKDIKPYWFDLRSKWTEIKNDADVAAHVLIEGSQKWIDETNENDPLVKITNGKTTVKKVKEKFIAELQSTIDDILHPFTYVLGDMTQPFLDGFFKVVNIITSVKEAYQMLKTGYQTARQILALLFGPRSHVLFPRTIRQAGSGPCAASGFYPSNIGYTSGAGIDLLINEGMDVVAPYAGTIMLTDNPNEVKIIPTDGSFSDTLIILTNIQPNSSIHHPDDTDYSKLEVYAGQKLGVATRTACSNAQNHIHVVMKKTNGNFIDPTQFIERRKIQIPTWTQKCNDYKFVFMDEVLAVGWPNVSKKEAEENLDNKPTTSSDNGGLNEMNEPSADDSSMFGRLTAAGGGRRRRKRSIMNNVLKDLGFPNITQYISDTLKKFRLKNLKMGKIVSFLHSLNMTESTKQLAQVIKRIKELIDAKPCFNPHQLPNDQLRNELADRSLPTSGSRDILIKRILKSEPRCPLIQLKMPKEIYCVFDEHCLAVQCCINVKVLMFNKAFRAFARIDPCDMKFVIGVNEWKYEHPLKGIYNTEKAIPTGIKFALFDIDLEIIVRYKIERTDGVALGTVSVAVCSKDYNSCEVELHLLNEVVLPLPVCHPNGSMEWPNVNLDNFFNVDSVKKQLKEAGKKLARFSINSVLKLLGIPKDLLTGKGPCPRPESMTINRVKKELRSRGLSDTGTRLELNTRINEDDITCKVKDNTFTLPKITDKDLKKLLHYRISQNCTRVDACVGFTIKSLDYTVSFRAYIELDVCKYMLKFGFENYEHHIPIFVYRWGEPQQLDISKQIALRFTIEKDDNRKVFVVSLSIKICFDGDCPIDVNVLANKAIPQPFCNEDFSLSVFTPGDGSIKKFLKELGGTITKEAFDYILKTFKLDRVFSDKACSVSSRTAPTCPWSLSLDRLPSNIKKYITCRLADNCFGANCCIRLPFKLPFVTTTIHKYVEIAFNFDPCEFTTFVKFGSFSKTETLGQFNWGEESTFTVGEGNPAPVIIRYSIAKRAKNAVLNLNVIVCLPIDGEAICVPDGDAIQVFKDKEVPLCDANAMAALIKKFEASPLKDYLKKQGLEIGKKIVGTGIDVILEQTGIKKHLKDTPCESSSHPYTPSVDGWRNECNQSIFKLPGLPESVKCHLDKDCKSLQCCVDVDFYQMFSHSFHFYVTLDTCDLVFRIGLEKLSYNYTLLQYHWGKVEQFDILNMFRITYSIDKDSRRNVFILNLHLCVSFDKNDRCDFDMNFMKDTEIPQAQCDPSALITNNVPVDINSLKKYMTKLGKKAIGMALIMPLRMLGLGSYIGVEGLCPEKEKPVENPCPNAPVFNISLPVRSGGVRCAIQSQCHGIECCADIDLGFMQRSFRARVTVDPFSYQISIGFEKWHLTRYLFNYQWGKEQDAALGSAISIRYSIGKNKTHFKINLRLVSALTDYTPVNFTILQDYMFPIPIINKGVEFRFPFSSWAEFKKTVGGNGGESVWTATKRFLGLDDIIDDNMCTRSVNQSINKERCPHLSMPKLPSAVQCTFDELCLGVTCCVEFDFKIVKKSLKTWLMVDSAMSSISIGFGNKYYNKTLGDSFSSGDRMTFPISKFANMFATIINHDAGNYILVDIRLQMKLYDTVVELDVLKDFRFLKSFKNQDWKIGGALSDFNFLNGTVTEKILRRLNFDMGFFDPRPCPQPSLPSTNNRCSIQLPNYKSINTNIRGMITDDCLGIKVCVKVKLLSLEYDFKVTIEFLPREYKLRMAVEKWELAMYIFQNFGIENTVYIKNGLGITYKLDGNTRGELVASFGIRICIDKHCADPIKLLDSVAIPMPYSLDNGTLIWPSADSTKHMTWLYNKALETSKDLLGVDENFLGKTTCHVPASASCPYFKLPPFPPSTRCGLSKYCTGIECCIDVQMKIAKWTFKAWALLDPCKFVFSFGFEKWMLNDTLFNYKWGEVIRKDIAGTILLEYTIGKTADNRKFELSVKFAINLERFHISIPAIVLLDKAHIPIPICTLSNSMQPKLVWQDPGKYIQQASAITLSRLGMDSKLIHASSCIPYSNARNNHRCPHFTLPSELPSGLSLRVMDMCTGIEACLPLDLAIIKRSFKVWIMVDPCNFKFSIGFEKWTMNTTLSESLIGKEVIEKIGRAVSLKYTVDKSADNRDFIFTLKVGLCLDGACTPDLTLIDNAMMPIPFCDTDGTFKWPSFDIVNGIQGASELVMNRLGVEPGILFGEDCNSPLEGNSNCPFLKLPTMRPGVNCKRDKYCTGVICCAQMDLKIVKRKFALAAIIDPCKFTLSLSFEKAFYNMSLTGYTWGRKATLTIGNVHMHYTIRISQDGKEFMTDLDLELCLDGTCAMSKLLNNQTMPIPLCTEVPGNITWPTAQSYGSVIYNILGVGLDFFKSKECLSKTSISSCSGVTLPSFAQTHCELASNCLGIHCCFDFDIHITKIKMMFIFEIDKCKNEIRFSLENKYYKVPLGVDLYGAHKVVAIGSMLSVKYRLLNTGYTFKANLDLSWCWINHFTGKKTCGNIVFLKETSFQQIDCPSNRSRRSTQRMALKSRNKRFIQVAGLGSGLSDIWSITKSLVNEGKSWKDINQHIVDISKKGQALATLTESKEHDSYRSQMRYVAERGVGSYMRGNKGAGWTVTVEGGEGIKAILGQVMDITGRLNEVFTPGEGLTNVGIKLLGAQLANMTIGDISALLDMQNLDPVVVFNLMEDMWKLFEAIYNDLIDAFTSGKMLEYLLGDLHIKAKFNLPKFHHTFFQKDIFFLVGGIVPMQFGVGIQGYIGLEIEIGAKVLKMFGYAIATPKAGFKVYGEMGIGFIVYAKLRLTGAICELRFPTMVDSHFSKFPLDIGVRMDLVLIPVILKLKALVTIEIRLLTIKIKKVLFKATIWKYQAPSIRTNIFDTHDKNEDDSGPIFEAYANKEPDTKFEETKERDSRSVSSRTNQCQVHQIAGRDYTEPAFELSMKATDDKSQVYLYLDIGFVPGGSELLKSKMIAGQSTVMTDVLTKAAGRPVHFRVRGENSGGRNAYVDCSIPTYDLTPPVARVKPNFFITSNRHVLEGSYRAFDDSPISREMFAFGFGKSSLDDQISPWKEFSAVVPVYTGPLGDSENYFTAPAEGRLLASISNTIKPASNTNDCASHCLKESAHKCMSFNYDYGKGACELLEGIESIDNKLVKSEKFYYFERLGSGSAVSLIKKDLKLTHNNLHYINVESMNNLGYRSMKSSSGILTDFTLPEPGLIANHSRDTLEFQPCGDLIPPDKDEWRGLCVGVDSREKNNRVIIDGEGSKTLFNGDRLLEDRRFTRANRYIAGNWDGFHDKESGIRGYTLAVGKTICEEHIRDHRDPHDHLNHESEWTHRETIEVDPPLKDGSYYLTIRALNKVDYGGPLAVTVCHTTPYVIDNTAPIMKKIENIAYNDVTSLLTANHNTSDPESNIMLLDACLGRTTRTCDIKEWFPLLVKQESIEFNYTLPDGIQTWIKLKAYNNVDMFTEIAADHPIVVDRSPPKAGSVFDGETVHVDQKYSKYANKICASWLGFSDPQSGLTSFELSVGTAPFSINIVNRHRIDAHHHSFCIDLERYKITLVHNQKYYFTVTAWNGGIRKMSVNATSDGVKTDLTSPVKGEVVDGGLDGFRDLYTSSRSSVVAGQFRGFSDPESGIIDTEIQVDVASSPNGEFETLHAYQSIYPELAFQWGHFHLKHKNRVRTTLRQTNGAYNSITCTTDGFLIDLTPPEVDYVRVVNETEPGMGLKYQTNDNTMSVSYGFHDEESGIDHYRVRLYESHENRKTLLYEFTHQMANQTIYSKKGLDIRNGAFIYAEVESANVAVPALNGVARSSDVKVDTSPPLMSYVLVGVNAGETEEKHNDTVFQSDTNGILATWKASDVQSGIEDYQVCVGTSADTCDVLPWKSMGKSEDSYISGLSLNLTSSTGKYYYVCVRAKNSAGLVSNHITGTRIAVLNEDVTGHLADGPDGTGSINQETIGKDVDVTLDGHTVIIQFKGFASHLYGIQQVEWAIGSSQLGEDIQPFTAKGIVLSEDSNSLFGHSGSGIASAPVDLEQGKRYFASVRVTTYQGNVLEASSDGFVVDQTPPSISITRLGLHDKQFADLTEGNSVYQQNDAALSASWQYAEDVGNIAFAQFAVSSIPGEMDIHPLTNNGRIDADRISSIPDENVNSTVKPRRGGGASMLEIFAGNDVGLISSMVSASIFIDNTPPTCGVVVCPSHVKGATELQCSWSGFKDEESGIQSFGFGVGSTPGRDDLYPLEVLPAHTPRHKVLVNATGRHYFVVVRATNFVGLTCEVTSSAITIDDTAPIPGVIVDIGDVFNVNYRNVETADDVKKRRSCKTIEDCQQIDATCQESMNQVGVAWTHFEDLETGINSYHLAVGTSPGGSQIKPFFPVPVTHSRFLITGLGLKGKEKIYVTLKAYNGAGLSSSTTSNGIYLSYVAQGLAPLKPTSVWDGNNRMEDMDYQHERVSMGRISARWDFNGDPCPASDYEWRIERGDGRVIQDYTNASAQSFGSYDGVKTEDGEMYYVKVKSTNALGQINIKRSDGLTIRRNQLLPGRVNDGDIVGFDLNFSPTTNQINANWQSFGRNDPIAVLSGNTGLKEEKSNSYYQAVRHYEVAVGTDRRYSHTRCNIVPYTNVGLNLSVTFKHLKLHTKGTYYTTVRAYSTSLAMAEVTSNGFKAGYNNGVEPGEITMSEFWSNSTHLVARWDNFRSDVGIMFYHAGLSNAAMPENYSCNKTIRKRADALFPIALRNIGDNTMVEMSGLNLSSNATYFLYVIGTDGAGLCNWTRHQFMVDSTPPDEGEIKVGPYWHLGAAFTASNNLIHVEWKGYGDVQSGLARYEVSLWSSTRCDPSSTLLPYADWIKLSTNYSSYSLIQLDLKEMIPYFVKLRAYNRAGLFVETVSKPTLLDESTLTAGDVIDGHTFNKDLVWQKSTSEVNGTFLHFATKLGTPCPDRPVDFSTGWTKYDGIGLGVQRGVRWGIKYSANSINDESGGSVSIHMTRVRAGYSYLKSGAIMRDADMTNAAGGDYIIRIRAAKGNGLATTSVLLLDGSDDMLQDLDWQDEPEWTGEHSINCTCCFKTPLPKVCPCDCESYRQTRVGTQNNSNSTQTSRQQKINYVNKTISDVVILKTAPTDFITQRSCGFQLVAGTRPYAVLWCSSFNDTLEKQKEKRYLDYDPSKEWHTYKIRIYTTNDDPINPQWCIEVFETKLKLGIGVLCGIEGFTPKTKLIFHLWNKNNFLPKSPDWRATAWFGGVRLPASDSNLCRYGSVFRGGSSAIISYEAGIGTQPMATDVAPFTKVAKPCIPCIHACDIFTCDKSCPWNKVTQIRFTLNGLTLPVTMVTAKQNNHNDNTSTGQIEQTNETNDTEQGSSYYFLTVKAVLGSGAYVTSSSNGFRIDTTAPVIDKDLNVTYIDFEQGQYKPVDYQSSNGTIKALWRCEDNESMIRDYQWAIGTEPGRTDIQNFTSVGRNPAGTRGGLEGILHHNHTYYVSIICTNFAGTPLKYEDEKGVTILLEKPIVKDIRTTIPGTKQFDNPVYPKNAREAESGGTIGITWTKARDQNIRRYEFGIGTSACEEGGDWIDDVFPFTWVGVNEAGKIEIKNGSVYYNDTRLNDTCSFSRTNYEDNRNKTSCLFNMEIGRTVFFCMKLCNLADKCVLKESGSATFVDKGKCSVASSMGGEGIEVTVTQSGSRKRAVHEIAEIKTPEGLEKGQTLVVGPLTRSDVHTAYGSDVSVDFIKYIQDPNATQFMTERALRGRIVAIDGSGFFVNLVGHVPVPGPLKITVPYLSHQKTNTSRPMLLHWDTGAISWMISSKTCLSQRGLKEAFELDQLRLNTYVCHTHSKHASLKHRLYKRSTDNGSYFKKETQFIVAQVSASPKNSPPNVGAEPMLTVPEDSAILRHILTASDPDGDSFVFAIDKSKPVPTGAAAITPAGKLEYEPCMDCTGIDTIYYTVTEVNMGDVTPLVAAGSISINVTGLDDAPELFLSRNGIIIFAEDSTFYKVNVSVEQNTGDNMTYADLGLLVGAYDRDTNDVLKIISQTPANGELTVGDPIPSTPDFSVDCHNLKAYSLPCTGLNLPHKETDLSWITVTFTYKPNMKFHGHDSFTLKAIDKNGFSTRELVITVNVLQNPCKNSGTCRGLEEDFNCTDHRRATVNYTEYYKCTCTGGWTGPFCDVDRDDCISIPCLYPFTCFDKLDGYECKCPEEWPECDKADSPTIIIISTSVCAVVIVSIIVAVVIIWRKRKHRKHRKAMSDVDDAGQRNSDAEHNLASSYIKPVRSTGSIEEVKNGGSGIAETSFQEGERTDSVTKLVLETNVSEEGTCYTNPAYSPSCYTLERDLTLQEIDSTDLLDCDDNV